MMECPNCHKRPLAQYDVSPRKLKCYDCQRRFLITDVGPAPEEDPAAHLRDKRPESPEITDWLAEAKHAYSLSGGDQRAAAAALIAVTEQLDTICQDVFGVGFPATKL